jgi:tryptophanyl-tRNA synthetase
MSDKKRLLTGLQPSGELHLGNYFGALKPFVDSYQDYESYIMVADYHALTSVRNPEQLRSNIYSVVRDYLTVGVDPEQAVIFRQSDNQDHMELGWIFNCLVTVPFLQQAHSYKDKIAKGIEANAGLFTYPMLQAADIALYDTDFVPVGEDQRQHLEYTREVVGKFNRAYGETLKTPQEVIIDSVGVVPGIDGQKMSKSYNNTIPLFGGPEEIRKAVMSIVTDSAGDWPEHVYAIHKLVRSEAELEVIYSEHKGRYGDLKQLLVADLEAFVAPLREKRESISNTEVKEVLAAGVARAKQTSGITLEKVRAALGITL